MLDKLLASPQLRQEASEKLLEIARFLSVDELAEQYEQALCQFLSPEVGICHLPTQQDCTHGFRGVMFMFWATFSSFHEHGLWCHQTVCLSINQGCGIARCG